MTLPGQDDAEVAAEIERLETRRRVSTLMTAAAAYYHSVLPKKIRQDWYRTKYGFTDETVDALHSAGSRLEVMTMEPLPCRSTAMS